MDSNKHPTDDVVDSSKEQLNMHDIVIRCLQRDGHGDHAKEDFSAALMAFVEEANMPDTYIRQFGNSLGIVHINGENAMFRILNVDTAKNFMRNAVDFFNYMVRDLGVRKAVTDYKGQTLRGFINAVAKICKMQNPEFNFQHEIIKSPMGDDIVVIYTEE